MTMQQITLSIIAAQDGGIVLYEAVDGENVLAFGGDLPSVTKYLEARMSKIIVTGDRKHEVTRAAVTASAREAPISTSLRRLEQVEAAE